MYAKQGQSEEAIAAYRAAIRLDASDAAPWYGLGNVYTLQEDLEQALTAFRRAVDLAPDSGMCHASLVGVLRRLGREEAAQQEQARALPLMADEGDYNRACFAAICGDVPEALRLLEIALQKNLATREWARRDPDFLSLHEEARFWALVEG